MNGQHEDRQGLIVASGEIAPRLMGPGGRGVLIGEPKGVHGADVSRGLGPGARPGVAGGNMKLVGLSSMPLRHVEDAKANGAREGGLVGFSGPGADRLTTDARTGTGASLW